MGYAITSPAEKPRRRTTSSSQKTASGDFFALTENPSLENLCNPLKPRQGNTPTPTKTASGVLYEHYRYTAFGEPEIYAPTGAKLAASAIDNTVLWNSRRYDADTNLYYYKYRHYKADIGRWLSRDPLGDEFFLAQYLNILINLKYSYSITNLKVVSSLIKAKKKSIYSFIENDPLNYYDYLGLCKLGEKKLDSLKGEVIPMDDMPSLGDDLDNIIELFAKIAKKRTSALPILKGVYGYIVITEWSKCICVGGVNKMVEQDPLVGGDRKTPRSYKDAKKAMEGLKARIKNKFK